MAVSLEKLQAALISLAGADAVTPTEGAGEFAVDGLVPKLHVRPESPEQLAGVLRLCTEQGAKVVPRGSGTKMELGNPPEAVDVSVSTEHLDKVLEYTPADMTVSVQAGIRLAELQRTLAAEGQFLALDPPYVEKATIGGILAANSSGPLRTGHGTARDVLIGIRVAHSDGVLTKAGGKVVKNVTGYDLNKLYVGSLGTLGVIVEANFKLQPLPALERTVRGTFPSTESADAAVSALVDSVLMPSAVELLNDPAALRALGGSTPEKSRTLLVRFGGRAEAVERQVRDMSAMFAKAGAMATEVLEGEAQREAWRAVCELPRGAAERGECVCRLSVLSSEFPRLMDATETAAGEQGLRAAFWGRALIGAGYVALLDSGGKPDAARAAVQSLRAALASVTASVVVESCEPAVKVGLDVWHGPIDAAALEIMKSIKVQFDPKRTLNPGRFVGGI